MLHKVIEICKSNRVTMKIFEIGFLTFTMLLFFGFSLLGLTLDGLDGLKKAISA